MIKWILQKTEQAKPVNRFRKVSILALGIAACLAVILTSRIGLVSSSRDANYINLLREAYDVVSKYYVEKPDPEKLAKGMIDWMLASLDPHNAYLPPEPYKEMGEMISGAFGG